MTHAPLMPNAKAAALWSLDVTHKQRPLRRALFDGAVEYVPAFRPKIEGPDETLMISYVVTMDDAEHFVGSDIYVGETTPYFWSVDIAVEAGLSVFAALAGPDDILVPGGVPDAEWPLVGPEHVIAEAQDLRARGMLTTWLQTLSRYRQFSPGLRRTVQYATVRLEYGRHVVIATRKVSS